MKQYLIIASVSVLFLACKNNNPPANNSPVNTQLAKVMDDYWQERMQLFPLEATGYGDNRYNDRMTITIAESFRDCLGRFYNKYLEAVSKVDSAGLNSNDLVSYRLMKYEMQMGIEGLKYPTHYIPINQFWAFTLDLPQLGSGSGNQPFKTVKDYDNWLKRLAVFPK